MTPPNTFIVGAPKCGTTSLAAYLSQHPSVHVPATKEPHFFVPYKMKHRVRSISEYEERCYATLQYLRCVDASVLYLSGEGVPSLIHEFCPSARIIIMLRPPVDLMYSLHGQLLKTSDEDETDFQTALDLQAVRRKGHRIPAMCTCLEYLQYERLATFSSDVQRYIDTFGREQVKVILLEDLAANATTALISVFEFLDVEPSVKIDTAVRNRRESVPSQAIRNFLHRRKSLHAFFHRVVPQRLYAEIKRRSAAIQRQPTFPQHLKRSLVERFHNDTQQLADIIRRDLSHWNR